jgi:hypothetical protein
MISLNLRCPKHPRYMGMQRPRTTTCKGCDCHGIWTIVQWVRNAEYPDAAREPVLRLDKDLVHSMLQSTVVPHA